MRLHCASQWVCVWEPARTQVSFDTHTHTHTNAWLWKNVQTSSAHGIRYFLKLLIQRVGTNTQACCDISNSCPNGFLTKGWRHSQNAAPSQVSSMIGQLVKEGGEWEGKGKLGGGKGMRKGLGGMGGVWRGGWQCNRPIIELSTKPRKI
jgi:hypothetical protein